MIPVAIAPVIEHIGDVYVVSAVADKDFVKEPGLHRTMLGDGLACLFASFFGGPPVTTYSEVTGAMQITRVTHPQVIRIAAGTALVFSVIGKLSALLQSIPSAVLGGIMLLLFGTIASVGVQNLIQHKVDLNQTRNIIIVSVTRRCHPHLRHLLHQWHRTLCRRRCPAESVTPHEERGVKGVKAPAGVLRL